MKPLIITNFSDPVCIWCWGTEPIFRALETHYPNQIDIRTVMGGLVDDINTFSDPGNGIDAGPEGANAQIVSHWLEAQNRHRMPVKPDGFHLFSKAYPSTYPQNIAYKAAQLADPDKADAFLRRIREATLTEAKVTSNPDVLFGLAKDVGLCLEAFSKALESGEAKQRFEEDLLHTQKAGVDVFPSFLVATAKGEQTLLRGYITYEQFQQVITSLSNGSLVPSPTPPSLERLLALLDKHPRLAFEEVHKAFDFTSRRETEEWLKTLVMDGQLGKEVVGSSYFIRKASL